MSPKDILNEYKNECTEETLRRQEIDVSSFQNFLLITGSQVSNMFDNLEEWRNVTSDKIEEFKKWLFEQGYAIGTIKVRISTLKVYCRLARKANVLSENELELINNVRGPYKSGYIVTGKEREKNRIGIKKETAVRISNEQAEILKKQQNTHALQGRRDILLMCLLLDQGLRISEIANIRMEDFSGDKKTLIVRSTKLREEKEHQHLLSKDTQNAIEQYLQRVSPQEFLLYSIHRSGRLREGITGRAINDRVRQLGEKIGLPTLAPEDCRYYWYTFVRPFSQRLDE